MKYAYQAVERIPKPMSEGVVYHSEEFEIGALLCACGCGHRVSLLVPDSHQIIAEGGWATVTPSISVCDADCKSHYFITGGEVEWMPAFSDATAASVMHRQIARHEVHEERKLTWAAKARRGFARAFNRLKSILRV
jgi:uncharacterized protein DUF6527